MDFESGWCQWIDSIKQIARKCLQINLKMTVTEIDDKFNALLLENSVDSLFIKQNPDLVKRELYNKAKSNQFYYELTSKLISIHKDSQSLSIVILFLNDPEIINRINGIELALEMLNNQFDQVLFDNIVPNLYYRDYKLLEITLEFLKRFEFERAILLILQQFVYTTSSEIKVLLVDSITSRLDELRFNSFKYLSNLVELGLDLCQARKSRKSGISLLLKVNYICFARIHTYYSKILATLAEIFINDPDSWVEIQKLVNIMRESHTIDADFELLNGLPEFKLWFSP